MAITKAEIFKIIHERLKSGGLASKVSSIDNDLRDCLYKLSNDIDLLLTSTTVTTTTNTAIVTATSHLKHWYAAAVDEGPLLELGDMDSYEQSIENTDDPATGEPTKICKFDGNFYLYDPIPDDAYTVRIYGVLHEDDVDDIDLADLCREALVWGVMYRLFVGGELLPDAGDSQFANKMILVNRQQSNSMEMYVDARNSLMRSAHFEPTLIKYYDV